LNLRRLGLISLGLLVLVVIIYSLVGLNNTAHLNKLTAMEDTRLATYDYAKELARKSLDLVSMDNQSKYTILREQFRKTMTKTIWDGYFTSEKYGGANKNFTIEVQDFVGEIVKDGDFVFKIDFKLVGEGTNKSARFFVYIKDNMIYKIESLG
jgi:hypothetical protein